MRFIPLKDFRNNSAAVLRQLKQAGALVVTSNGKPVAMLRNLNEDNLQREMAEVERDKFIAALANLQYATSTRPTKPTKADIQKEIRAVRLRRAA
jgi:antitoxin (DNA-binding transcriptional repressor) of toxin-antitoxin stability system